MEKSQLRNFIQEKLKKTLNENKIESGSQVVMWDDEEHEVVRREPDEEYGERVYIRRKAPSAMLGKLDDLWVPAGELNEANPDGTVSPDEDERENDLMMRVEVAIDNLLFDTKREAYNIGGEYRGPGIWNGVKKLIKSKL